MSDNQGFWSWLGDAITLNLEKIGGIATVLTGVSSFIFGFDKFLAWGVSRLAGRLVKDVTADISAYYPVVENYLALCNSFVPLAETFNLLMAWATLWVACAGYRLAKSYLWGAS